MIQSVMINTISYDMIQGMVRDDMTRDVTTPHNVTRHEI